MSSMLDEKMVEELKELGIQEVLFGEPMSNWTSLKVGGRADALTFPKNQEEIEKLSEWIEKRRLPSFVMGVGTNLLVRDGGIRGVVINISKGFQDFKIVKRDGDAVLLYAESGIKLSRLIEWSLNESLSGLENLTGIPGSLGGALAMNAGTKDGTIGNIVEEISLLGRDGKIKKISKNKLDIGYRNTKTAKGMIIISALLRLKAGDRTQIEQKIKKIKEHRIQNHPLDLPSAGSIFKNPKNGKAWELIDEAGLKGVRVGKARISTKHTNWIVNEGGATAKDILILIGLAKDKVREKFGVMLETEIKTVGEDV